MDAVERFLAASAVVLGAALPASGFAQVATQPVKAQPPLSTSWTDGEVRKVDLDNGKLTIKHGEIRNLGMPGMTMVFTAKDRRLLAGLKAGDKVRFVAAGEGGKLIVTEIRAVR